MAVISTSLHKVDFHRLQWWFHRKHSKSLQRLLFLQLQHRHHHHHRRRPQWQWQCRQYLHRCLHHHHRLLRRRHHLLGLQILRLLRLLLLLRRLPLLMPYLRYPPAPMMVTRPWWKQFAKDPLWITLSQQTLLQTQAAVEAERTFEINLWIKFDRESVWERSSLMPTRLKWAKRLPAAWPGRLPVHYRRDLVQLIRRMIRVIPTRIVLTTNGTRQWVKSQLKVFHYGTSWYFYIFFYHCF